MTDDSFPNNKDPSNFPEKVLVSVPPSEPHCIRLDMRLGLHTAYRGQLIAVRRRLHVLRLPSSRSISNLNAQWSISVYNYKHCPRVPVMPPATSAQTEDASLL